MHLRRHDGRSNRPRPGLERRTARGYDERFPSDQGETAFDQTGVRLIRWHTGGHQPPTLTL